MEKIIAVVIMLVIVIGLIATIFVPQGKQAEQMGNQVSNQMDKISAVSQENRVFGVTVKNDYIASKTNDNKKVVVNDKDDKAISESDIKNLKDNSVFSKAESTDVNGDITITYTQVDLSRD